MEGEGRARGRGRSSGRGHDPTARIPGNGGDVKQAGPRMQPVWGQPSGSAALTSGRGSGSTSSTIPSIAPGPRYNAPTRKGAEGRATLHRVQEVPTTATTATGGNGRGDNNSRGDIQRGAFRGKRIITDIIRTKPENVSRKQGTTGRLVTLTANYFKLVKKPEWCLYQYRVDFNPPVEIAGLRRRLIYEQKGMLGGYLFDGSMLFVTRQLQSEKTECMSKDRDGNPIQTIIKFVGTVSMSTASSLQVLNLILRRSMEGLKLQLVGRNFFDAVAKIDIREFNVQLWPGYVTSIRQHEQDILLCAEITNKVMRTETIYDIMQDCHKNERDFKSAFQNQVLGMTVLTDYNNKTYRIDDIDFTKTPKTTFDTKSGSISFIEYYKTKYNIVIRDANQPLLLSKSKGRDIRGGESELIALVPELCRATGLTDSMKNNFRLTKAMSDYTRMVPDKRIKKLLEFNQRLATTPESTTVLVEWNFKLDSKLVELPGRVLKNENIIFGNSRKVPSGQYADWTMEFRNNSMYASVELKRWFVIFPQRSNREASDFVKCVQDVARGMHFVVDQPNPVPIENDRQQAYNAAIESCLNKDPQLIMIIVPNNNADRYSNIKKKCCVDRPMPTQVMCHKTIVPKGGNPRTLMSVATKVAIQMNCKLGGAPWMVEMPLAGLMVIGFDVCHDTKDKSKSYGALVATMDMKTSCKYFSAVSAHRNGEELSNEFTLNVTKALKEFRNIHGTLPQKILIYRDGVGEGQTNYVYEHETKVLKNKLAEIYKSAGIEQGYRLAFIIVSKKINSRFFLNNNNPPPGTVVDDIVTLPERYDFFLVSQSAKQGTVSPTSYNIISDNMGLEPDKLQILSYKMTHLYYNWSGTTRVPAVCQYAHKLAFLVGQYIHQSPSHLLEKQLYFL